jgi:hypothetical protein
MDLAGTWSLRRHYDGSSLNIQTNPSGNYGVEFSTGSCQGGCKLERHGEFRDGVLTLDQPVAEYSHAVYQKLYAIRIADTDYIVPSPFVPAVAAALSSDGGAIVDEARFNRSVYRRAN